MSNLKMNAAKAALNYIEDDMVVGVGTGSTVNYFIDQLATIKHRIDACVPSSMATEMRLRSLNIPIIDLNAAPDLPIYVDGADEVNTHRQMIKGGGGALTREKIIATVAKTFICIVDESKLVTHLGDFPLSIEVIPIARSFVARELLKLGGDPQYREGFITDNGNIILDVHHLDLSNPKMMENTINIIPGVVENGLFAARCADHVLIATQTDIKHL